MKQNSILNISGSTFKKNFSFDKGGAIRGDYQQTSTFIKDT